MSRYRGVERFGRYRTPVALLLDKIFGGSVAGEGFTLTAEEFESQRGTFYGSPNVNVTGLVIDDVSIFYTPDTTPKVIRATLYDCIRWSGTRTYSVFGYPVPILFTRIRHTDLDFRWEVVYEDDSPIEDSEGILSAFTRENVNPYLDQIGTILSAVGRKAGVAYKIKGYAYGKNGDAIRGASFEKLIPAISDNALPTTFLDWEFGNDTNDGKDPLGLSLSGATYNNATRTITLAGGFTTYDHAAATSNNRTQWFNKLYLLSATEPGFTPQLVEIESKTSDDGVVIKQSLGANYTGITSSNGPKLTLQTSGINNTRQCPKLGGNYSISSSLGFGNAGVKEFVGWGASGLTDARIIKSTAGAITDFFSNESANLSGTTWWTLSRITLDGEYTKTLTTGAGSGENGVRDAVLFFDRSTLKGSSGGQTFGYNFSGALQYDHKIKLFMYGGEMNNLTNPEETIAKTNGMYITLNPGAWFTYLGTELKCDSDGSDLHHYVYPTYSMSNSHVAWVHAVEGVGANYVFNMNMIYDSENISVVRNYFGQDGLGSGAKRGVDLSKTNNASDNVEATDAYIVDNDFNVKISPVYWASVNSARIAFNRVWGSQVDKGLFEMLTGWHGGTLSARNYIDNNKVYGTKLINQQLESQYVEATDNIVYVDTDNNANDIPEAWLTEKESKFTRNNFYAPNKTGGNPLKVGSSNYSVEGFNTLTGGENTSTNPEWIDPANGDFSTVVETYFTDFSTDTIGQLPANTTLKRNAVAADYQVVDDGGVNVLRFQSTGTENARGLAFSSLQSSGVTEIFARVKDSDTSPPSIRLLCFASDSPDNEYGAQQSSAADTMTAYRRVSGTFASVQQLPYISGVTNYRNILFRITPGSPNQLQIKVWPGDRVTDEPGSWFINTTDANRTLVDGWIGVVGFDSNLPAFYECFGIGINGQPAPRSA